MAQGDALAAVPVWLDLEREQLRHGDKTLYLRPKSFALLRYLVAHPGRSPRTSWSRRCGPGRRSAMAC